MLIQIEGNDGDIHSLDPESVVMISECSGWSYVTIYGAPNIFVSLLPCELAMLLGHLIGTCEICGQPATCSTDGIGVPDCNGVADFSSVELCWECLADDGQLETGDA